MQQGKPKKKYSQAARLHDVIRLIEARHGLTIEEIAEETGVTLRTVHRDLNAIHSAGYPLVSDLMNRKRVYRFITRFKDVPTISFTLQELATLYFLKGQAAVFLGTPFEGEIEEIFRKVRSVLPPRYAAHLERITGVALPLIQGRHDYSKSADSLKLLRDALVYQNRLEIRYLATGRKRTVSYAVDPYTLVLYKGGLYLVGYAHNRKALRTFAVERIKGVTVTPQRFELPDDYRPEERLGSAFGIVAEEAMPVRIRFSAAIAHSIRGRIWHPSQRFRELADGGVELTFSAGGKLEIISWILSYGEHAEILEPPELRAALCDRLESMVKCYA